MSTPAQKMDPVDLAFESAPERPATEAEVEAVRQAKAEIAAGGVFVPHDEVMRRARERFRVE
jgi:hypothetical protein